MATIKIKCSNCNKIHEVFRSNEIPDKALSMGCNMCPDCDGESAFDYDEWYYYDELVNIPLCEIDKNQVEINFNN